MVARSPKKSSKSPKKSPRKSIKGGRRTAEERSRPKCEGETDIFTGEQIPEGRAIRLLSTLYNPPKYECFDVISLAEWFSTKKEYQNPNTRAMFTEAQVSKIKKKLEKLKSAGVDVPEINLEGEYDHGAYDDFPVDEDDEDDETDGSSVIPASTVEQIEELMSMAQDPGLSVEDFVQFVNNNFHGNEACKLHEVKPGVFLSAFEISAAISLARDNNGFYDSQAGMCDPDYGHFIFFLLFVSPQMQQKPLYKSLYLNMLDEMKSKDDLYDEEEVEKLVEKFENYVREHISKLSATQKHQLMSMINVSDFSTAQKRKFEDILIPPQSGFKRTRTGAFYGGSKKKGVSSTK